VCCVMKLLIGHVVATLIHVARVVSTANVVDSRDYRCPCWEMGEGCTSSMEIVVMARLDFFTTYEDILYFTVFSGDVDNIDSMK